MCNEVARRIALHQIREDFSQLKIRLVFPEGLPNFAPTDSVRITDRTPVVRWTGEEAALVMRRWSWPGPGGRPVYNYRSDGRRIDAGRCLVPVDAFYDFTTPSDPKAKRKDKWAFSHANDSWFCLAGVVRADPAVGEAFSLLTTEPGADVAPYHSRQVVVVERRDWQGWLDGSLASVTVAAPLPPGTLKVASLANASHQQR